MPEEKRNSQRIMVKNAKEKDELAELLAEYFADEKAEREADEAGYRLFMEAPENPEYEVKPDCPSTDRIRAVWLEQATWNRDEKQHIDSCQHCRVFIPYFQTRLNDRLGSPAEFKANNQWTKKARIFVQSLYNKIDGSVSHIFASPQVYKVAIVPLVCVLMLGIYWPWFHSQPKQVPRPNLFSENFLEQYDKSGLDRVMRGTASSMEPFNLTPVATAIRTHRPRFQWRGVPGQNSYQVHIWRGALSPNEKELKKSPVDVEGDSWQTNWDLSPGIYRWNVNVVGQPPSSPGTIFVILNSADVAEVSKLEKLHANDDVSLASLYMKHKLYIDAYAPLVRLYSITKDQRLKRLLQIAERASGKTRMTDLG